MYEALLQHFNNKTIEKFEYIPKKKCTQHLLKSIGYRGESNLECIVK
jgi:hypothetical protein